MQEFRQQIVRHDGMVDALHRDLGISEYGFGPRCPHALGDRAMHVGEQGGELSQHDIVVVARIGGAGDVSVVEVRG